MFYYLGLILKRTLLITDLVIFSFLLYVLSFLPQSLLDRFYPRLFWAWSRTFVRALDIRLHLHQKNARPLPKQYLLIANHPSAFEDIGIPALFNVFSLAKIEVLDWPIVGRISAAAGTLFVKREERESRRQAFEEIIASIEMGRNVALYPEGGCKGRRIFETFRHGVFEISLQTGVPILPVFLEYEMQEQFEWKQGETLPQKIWHYLSASNRRVNYYVFDAIEPEHFKDKEEYMQYVHERYVEWQGKYLE